MSEQKIIKNQYITLFIWNSRRYNTLKKEYIYRSINFFQPDILYVIDNMYDNLNNLQYYSRYYDGRNILFIRNEIKHNTYIIQQNKMIVPLLNMCFIYITPNNPELNEWIKFLREQINNNYFIIGDINIKSNKQILNLFQSFQNYYLDGEETLQTIIFHKDKDIVNNAIVKKFLAPSDHKALYFKCKIPYTSSSKLKMTKINNTTDYNQIKDILLGNKLEIEVKFQIKRSKLVINDKYLVIRSIVNYYLSNNPSSLYKYFSNIWSKYRKEPILGNNIPTNVISSIKDHLLHNEDKNTILISQQLIIPTFDPLLIQHIQTISKPKIIRKRNLLKIKSSYSRALNEDLFSLTTISNKVKNFIYNLIFLKKYDEVQKILANIIKAYNEYIKNENAKVFYLIKNPKLIDFKDVRMITIIPTYFYIFESLYFNEINDAIDKIVNVNNNNEQLIYQFGALSFGGTMNAMTFLRNKIEFYNKNNKTVNGLFIADIQFGYDSINWNILDNFIENEYKFNNRQKNLFKIWSILNRNMNIWISHDLCKRTIGIPMGCALSPAVFVYYVHKTISDFYAINNIVMYIDDLTLILNDKDYNTSVIQDLIDILWNKGQLKLKMNKSKIISDSNGYENKYFKMNNELIKFNTGRKFTFLGRDLIFKSNNILPNDENIVIIDKNRIKKFPKWLTLGEKRILFNGALHAKQRFIGYMQSINNRQIRKTHLEEARKYFTNNFDNTSYRMILFLMVNIYRLFFDSFDLIQLKNKIIFYNNLDNNNSNHINYDDDNYNDIMNQHIFEDNDIKVYTDGSYNSNNNTNGYGIVFVNSKGKIYTILGKIDNKYNEYRNIISEIYAIVKAITILKHNNINKVTICYDYIGLEKWIDESWKTKNNITRAYKKFIENSNVTIHWVKIKSHSHNKYNDLADSLAKQAAKSNINAENVDLCNNALQFNKDLMDIYNEYFYKKILTGISQIDEITLESELPIQIISEKIDLKNSFKFNKMFLNKFLDNVKLNIIKINLDKISDVLNIMTNEEKNKFKLIYTDHIMLSKLINKHAWLMELSFFNLDWFDLSFLDKYFNNYKNRMNLFKLFYKWIIYIFDIFDKLKIKKISNINLNQWLYSKYVIAEEEETNYMFSDINKGEIVKKKEKIFNIEKRLINNINNKKDLLIKFKYVIKKLNFLQKLAYAVKRKKILNDQEENKMDIIKQMWTETRKLAYNIDKIWYSNKIYDESYLINELIILIRENKELVKMIEDCENNEEVDNFDYYQDDNIDEEIYDTVDEIEYNYFESEYF